MSSPTTADAGKSPRLSADAVVDAQKEDALAVVREVTGGRGVDVVIDCTAGAGSAPTLLGVAARNAAH